MKKTKTVEQWLKELPESIRPLMNIRNIGLKQESLSGALISACVWSETKEGKDFWNGLHESLKWAEEG